MLNYINQTAPALLQSILTASKNAVTVYEAVRGPNGTIIDLRLCMLNTAAERHLGHPASEVVGLPFDQLLPHLVGTGLYDRYRQVIETGQSTQFEFQYTRPDRPGPCWCDVSAVRMDDSVVVTYDDVTRRKADANAARLTSVLEQAFDASVNGITVLEAISDEQGETSDFRFLMINEAGLRMSGYTREYLLNRTLWEVYPATGINGLFAQYKQVFQTGHPYSGEHYYPEYDVWRSIHVVRIPGGLMLSYTDCTAEKKRAEKARQQADLLQAILDGSPNAILAFDAEVDPIGAGFLFRCTLQNRASRRLTGRSDQEIKGLTIGDIFPALLTPEGQQRFITVFITSQAVDYELMADLGAGQGRYTLSVVKQDSGLLLTIQDKTAEKQAITRLHQQDQLLRSIAENSPAGLVLWEAVYDDSPRRTLIDFRYKLANQTNSYLTGYPAEALIGQNLLNLFPRFKGTELEKALRETLETGCTQRMGFSYYTETPDRWFDAQFVRVGDGDSVKSVLMVYIDVTQAHQGQLTQLYQAELTRRVLNAQPTGIVLYEPVRAPTTNGQSGPIVDFTFALVNQTQLAVTGRSERELIGQKVLTLYNSPDGLAFFDLLVDVAETGQSREWLMPYFNDGIRGWFQSLLIRHSDQVLFTFLDVSELKLQQQALETANLELRRSNDNLMQFARIASHDLQEPLRKIQSFGDILTTNYVTVLDEPALGMINRMQSAAQQMSVLIRDLLDYSRVSTHRAPFSLVLLNDLLAKVTDDLSPAIEQTGTTIEWTNLPAVYGIKNQLHQLFQQLLSNAIKFRKRGVAPHVRISCRTIHTNELPLAVVATMIHDTVNGQPTPRFVYEIDITDNGIGFDEKYLDRIFQVFQRLHRKHEYEGTGVGLAICRKVVENHQGHLMATSQPDQGATFQVYLPVLERT